MPANLSSSSTVECDAQAMAVRIGRTLTEMDTIGRRFGITMLDIGPGSVRLSMPVADDMIGGHGLCHGAFLFALADTACGYASASRNARTLSQTVTSSFVAPVQAGQTLEAIAVEVSTTRGSAWYDVRVVTQDGDTVAVFRTHCRILPGIVV